MVAPTDGDGADMNESEPEDRLTIRRVVEAMAMPFAIDVVVDRIDRETEKAVDGAVGAFHADLRWADDVFSLWRDDTPLSRLARGEISVEDCPPAVGEVLAECERYRVETDGFFDARRPDGVLDPTGIVKTWAVARATWRLDALGASGYMVGASGDAVVSGTAPDGMPWRVGIADPRRTNPHEAHVLDVVELGGDLDPGRRSLATSGTAQHGEHLWNPRSKEYQAAYAQVSVVGSDLVECDAWATAIAAGGATIALAAQRRGLEVLCIPPGSGVEGGSVAAESSPGWPGIALR